MTRTEDYVVTDRGGIVENQHGVYAAVVDGSGKLLFAVGNPSRMTLARSAAKPAQALAVLETDGFGKFGFDEADLALMCASHSSEDRHIKRARAMLGKVEAEETDLRCGGHPALSETVNRNWVKKDYSPTAICNNCSGKHAGMLGGARALGAEIVGYHLSDHPMQMKVKRVFEELCGLNTDDVRWGVDGCNLPAPAVPLRYMAKMYAAFAKAADDCEADRASADSRTRDQALIFRAMTQYPEMVGGEGRFCTRLMKTFKGDLIGKLGADGFYGIGIRSSEQTKRLGADRGIGIAVKIEDGSIEILYAVVMEILEQLEIGSTEMRRELSDFHHLQRLNTAGVVTGQVSLAFNVRAC
ncbi:L-asparaginase II [Thelonectria olida]|uniref:L-asparaginase II n=1 Tax=Thelonectria olida TaxID=1576542 RepID=A0A9P8VS52_9HYPO|nr:L-asparaginase II [Thelonectria olida]